MNNILTFAGVTPTVENNRLVFAKGEERMSITKLELVAINLWLASMDAHNLPTLLKVGNNIFTVANTTTLPLQEYTALLKAMKHGQLATDEPIAPGTFFTHEVVEMVGSSDSPLYLRLDEGTCEAVFAYSLTIPDGTPVAVVDEVMTTAMNDMAKKIGGGSIPLIRRELTSIGGEVQIQTLMGSYEAMTASVFGATLLDDLLDVVDQMMLPDVKEAA